MTGRGPAAPGMAAAGSRILDLLTMADAAVLLGRRSVRTVQRLADAGELERVRFGRLVRITPESVEAYKQRMAGHAKKPPPSSPQGRTGEGACVGDERGSQLTGAVTATGSP